MEWVIVSDNHGQENILTDIKTMHPDALLIHLGDSEFEINNPELDGYVKVKGNVDYAKGFEESIVLHQDSLDAFITHGHLFQVGLGLEKLALEARKNNCELAFYGHTHIKNVQTVDGVVCINPGSIAQSRSEDVETYAVLTLDESEKMITFLDRNHQVVSKEILVF